MDPEKDEQGTKNLGCGNAFEKGRCTDGSDPINCIYQNVLQKGIEKCVGNLQLLRVPMKYECREQRGRLKCVKVHFQSTDECQRDCPGLCNENYCIV